MGDWEWSNMAPTIWMESKNRKAIFKAWNISNIIFWIEPPSGWIAQVMALLLFLLMRLDLPFSSQSTKRIKKTSGKVQCQFCLAGTASNISCNMSCINPSGISCNSCRAFFPFQKHAEKSVPAHMSLMFRVRLVFSWFLWSWPFCSLKISSASRIYSSPSGSAQWSQNGSA